MTDLPTEEEIVTLLKNMSNKIVKLERENESLKKLCGVNNAHHEDMINKCLISFRLGVYGWGKDCLHIQRVISRNELTDSSFEKQYINHTLSYMHYEVLAHMFKKKEA